MYAINGISNFMWVNCELQDEKNTKAYFKVMSTIDWIQVGLLYPAVVQCLDVPHICMGQVRNDESHLAGMPVKVGLN